MPVCGHLAYYYAGGVYEYNCEPAAQERLRFGYSVAVSADGETIAAGALGAVHM